MIATELIRNNFESFAAAVLQIKATSYTTRRASRLYARADMSRNLTILRNHEFRLAGYDDFDR